MTSVSLKVGVIGMGNVGPAFASAMRAAGHDVVGVSARSPQARDRAEAMLPGIPLLSSEDVARSSEVIVLAIPDDQIEPVVSTLVESGTIRPGQIVLHLCGAQGVAPLEAAAKVGAIPIALHPAMTFSGTSLDVHRLQGCPIAYTCSALAQPFAVALIAHLGGVPFPVREEDRPLYHAGLAHVANHLVTLIAEGELTLGSIGIDEPSDVLRPLVTAAVQRGLEEGMAGLTGPVARGNWETVAAHLFALDHTPELAQVAKSYRILAQSTKVALHGDAGSPIVVQTREDLQAALATDPRETAVVMTMGALHEGHLSLVEQVRGPGRKVVVTIFVNPEQFGPGEDFEKYPRSLEADIAALAEVGADIVYAPPTHEVYPHPSRVHIVPGPAGDTLEGYLRPGHFAGVLQVVGKMMNLIRPHTAIFGQKDAQQFVNIRQMVEDMDLPLELIQAPIVRSPEGLALSSRNAYLSEKEREDAGALHHSLLVGKEAAEAGASATEIVQLVADYLRESSGVDPNYVALADTQTFAVKGLWTPDGNRLGVEKFTDQDSFGPAYLLIAAQVGPARLIDNMIVQVQRDG